MKDFTSFKEFIVKRCKEEGACQPEFKRLLLTDNYVDLLKVLTDNDYWCFEHKIINSEILSNVSDEILLEANIYISKTNLELKNGSFFVYNSTVTARGNSTVTAWENSTVTARGNSTVTAWGNSTVTARGNSYLDIYICDQNKVNDKAVVRERSTGNVYFKKDAFNVVLIS